MCVLIFSTTFVWNISQCKQNSDRHCHICTYVRLHANRKLFLQDFTETRIFLDIFEKKKCSNTKFWENPLSGIQAVPCGRTDRYDETGNRFSHFYEGAPKPGMSVNVSSPKSRASRQRIERQWTAWKFCVPSELHIRRKYELTNKIRWWFN